MPTITQIKPQKNQRRVNIYLDGQYGFGIDLDNVATLNLREGTELTEKEIEEIVKKAEFQKSLDKILKFATFRQRSIKEINDYFRRKKIHESLKKPLFDRLKHFSLIGDKKFAEWWVRQRLQFKSKSKREIEYELRNKGIDKEIIAEVFSETKVDEEKSARELLEKKAYKWKTLPERKGRQKMAQYLAGKGFSWEVIEKVLEN